MGKGGYYTHHKFGGKLLIKCIEIYNTREEAEAREKQLKGWPRKKKEALIVGSNNQLIKLSKKNFKKQKP